MNLQKLLIKIAEILDRIGALYCITGGYAVSVWGRPRATFDIDVLIKLKTEELNLLTKSLKSLSKAGYLDENVAKTAIKTGGEFNYIHPESGIKVDFWVIKKDSFSLNELKRRVAKKMGSQTIYLVSPEDLILSKLRWHKKSGSTQQIEDVKSVLKIQKKKLDYQYLEFQAKKQTVNRFLDKLLKAKK